MNSIRSERGMATLSVLLGTTLGVLVLAGLLAFWMTLDDAKSSAENHTTAESAAIQVLNRIGRDVQEAHDVMVAADTELVVAKRDADDEPTWVRYALDEEGTLFSQTLADAPVHYDYTTPAEAHFAGVKQTKLAFNYTAERAAGVALFVFYDRDGAPVATPAFGDGTAKTITRVDIRFAADAGDGYVELGSSAAVKARLLGDASAKPPACPKATLSGSSDTPPVPMLTWGAVGGATQYIVKRDGIDLITISVTDGASDYTHTDETLDPNNYDPVNYQVLASGPGGISGVCAVSVWYPRLLAPNLTGAVLPHATQPNHWTAAAMTAPRIELTWAPVVGATSYRVYSRVTDPRDGTPVDGQDFELHATVANPMFVADEAPATRRDFYVVAANQWAASEPSATVALMTHPQPVALIATATDYSVNTLTWNLGASEDIFVISRRDADVPGSPWVEIAQLHDPEEGVYRDNLVADPTDLSDQSELGSRYAYRVDAYNTGPRGAATPERFAARHVGVATVLQFPADPAYVAAQDPSGVQVSAAGTSHGDYTNDGRNIVSWPAVASATRYEVPRFWTRTAATLNATLTTTDTSIADTGAAPGSRFYYMPVAVNETGKSPNSRDYATFNTRAVAYQRPAEPSLVVRSGADLNTPDATLRWTRTGDRANANAGYPFCAEDNLLSIVYHCSYELIRVGQGVVESGPEANESFQEHNWGRTITYRVQACNPGGCSTRAETDVNTYPGPFEIDRIVTRKERWYNLRSHDGSSHTLFEHRQRAGARVGWTASAGVRETDAYAVTRTVVRGDPNNRTFTNRLRDRSERTYPLASTGDFTRSTPGAQYRYQVTATAANGLSRTADEPARVAIAPASPVFFQSGTFCNPAQSDNGWKLGYLFSKQAYSDSKVNPSEFSTDWFRGRVPESQYDNAAGWFRDKADAAYNQPPDDPNDWNGAGNVHGWGYAGTNGEMAERLLGQKSNLKLALNGVRHGASMRVGSFEFRNDAAWNWENAWEALPMYVAAWKVSTGPVSCTSKSGWNWNENLVPTQRWVYPKQPGDTRITEWDVTVPKL